MANGKPGSEHGALRGCGCLPCCRLPVVQAQAGLRKSVTRNIALLPGEGVYRPEFALEKADGFRITGVRVLPRAKTPGSPRGGGVELLVNVAYTLWYTDGAGRRSQTDTATFELELAGVGELPPGRVKCFETGRCGGAWDTRCGGRFFRLDALAEAFGEILCPCTGALILDIGVFFILRQECRVQLVIPVLDSGDVPADIFREMPHRPSG